METSMKRSASNTVFMAIVAATAWFGVLVQYYLNTGSAGNFFSYFTIDCNLLIAVTLTVILLAPSSAVGRFFSTVSFQSALALYIFIVGLVYNTVLRGLVPLEGMGLLVDTVLHVIVPLLYIIYWFTFIPRGELQWKDGIPWLVFPFLYLIYSLIRGSIVGWYPYPFLNATKHGYPQVILNISLMIAVFLIGAMAVIAINRSGKKASA